MWLQIGISGWLTGDYSLRCQPVDYSNKPEVLRVGDVFRVINIWILLLLLLLLLVFLFFFPVFLPHLPLFFLFFSFLSFLSFFPFTFHMTSSFRTVPVGIPEFGIL